VRQLFSTIQRLVILCADRHGRGRPGSIPGAHQPDRGVGARGA
jgi:hypothetical protein